MILKNKLTGIFDKDCDSVNSNTYFLSFLGLIPLNARKRYRNIIRGRQAGLTPSTHVFIAFNSQSLASLDKYILQRPSSFLEVLCRSVLELFGSLSVASV